MTTVRTKCPDCGDVDLPAGDITLVRKDVLVRYTFECPKCHIQREKKADKKVTALLLAAGVVVVDAYEREPEAPALPPITMDEILEFHFELENWDGDVQ